MLYKILIDQLVVVVHSIVYPNLSTYCQRKVMPQVPSDSDSLFAKPPNDSQVLLVVLGVASAYPSVGLVGPSGVIGPSGIVGPSGPVQFHQPAWAFLGHAAHAHIAALNRVKAPVAHHTPAKPTVYQVRVLFHFHFHSFIFYALHIRLMTNVLLCVIVMKIR